MIFKLLDKHILVNCQLHKVFNRNTVYTNYNCTSNLETTIRKQNARNVKDSERKNKEINNGRDISKCLMNGACKNGGREQGGQSKVYLGWVECSFQQKKCGTDISHHSDWKHRNYTKLDSYVREVNDKNVKCV